MVDRLEIAEWDFMERSQERGVIMLSKYEAFVFVGEGGNATGILSYISDARVIQPQQSTY